IRTTPKSARTTSCSRKSMTARASKKVRSAAPLPGRALMLAAAGAVAATVAIGCGTTYYEIPIETPIQPKMDVSPFQRVLVAGFVAGGNEDVDANQETVRLLRSQLWTKSQLKVIDADLLPLMEVAQDQAQPAASDGQASNGDASRAPKGVALPQQIK